jgi:hypothetical protein
MDKPTESHYSSRDECYFRRAKQRRYFRWVPTTFTESGDLDLESQKRCVDFMIDAGSNGILHSREFSRSSFVPFRWTSSESS